MAFKLAEAYVQLSSRGMGAVRRALGGIGRGLTALLNPAAMVGAALAAIGTGVGIGSMLRYAAAAETLSVQFEVLLKSAGLTKEVIADINKFAASTPFEQAELGGVTKSLLNAGVEQKKLIFQLRQLGDIAAITGADLAELTQIWGKAKGTGVVMTEIFDQLAERNIRIGPAIATAMGIAFKSIDEANGAVRAMAPTQKITFAILEKAFASLTSAGGLYFEGMKKLAQTLAGLWSTFTGNLKLSLGRLGQILIDTFNIKDLLRNLGNLLKDFGENIDDIRPTIQGFKDDVVFLKDAIFSLGGVIRDTSAAWDDLDINLSEAIIGVKDLDDTMKSIVSTVEDISFGFRNWGDNIAMAVEVGLLNWRTFVAAMEHDLTLIGGKADRFFEGMFQDPLQIFRDTFQEMRDLEAPAAEAFRVKMEHMNELFTAGIAESQRRIEEREFERVRSRVPEKGEGKDDAATGDEGGPPPIPDPGKVKDGKFRITSLAGLADQMQSEAGKRIAERNAEANIRTAVAVEKMAAEKVKPLSKIEAADKWSNDKLNSLIGPPIPAFQ